jgi:hypothetical protein
MVPRLICWQCGYTGHNVRRGREDLPQLLSVFRKACLPNKWSYRCGEHEPVIPSQCLYDDGPAIESTRGKQYRENRQGYLDPKNERATRDRVDVIRCWPFGYVCKRGERRHVVADGKGEICSKKPRPGCGR